MRNVSLATPVVVATPSRLSLTMTDAVGRRSSAHCRRPRRVPADATESLRRGPLGAGIRQDLPAVSGARRRTQPDDAATRSRAQTLCMTFHTTMGCYLTQIRQLVIKRAAANPLGVRCNLAHLHTMRERQVVDDACVGKDERFLTEDYAAALRCIICKSSWEGRKAHQGHPSRVADLGQRGVS